MKVGIENEDSKGVCNKSTNIYKQNPTLNGFIMVSELEDVLQSGHYKYLLGYDNVDWFVIKIF